MKLKKFCDSNMSCPIRGQYKICQMTQNSNGDSYLHFQGVTEVQQSNNKSLKVEARRTKGGAKLALIRRLKKHQSEGVDYSDINDYFRYEFGDVNTMNPMGIGFISDILTYDPRNDTVKSYDDVYKRLNQAPSSIDWTIIWDVIEGLVWD